jgi:excisionase family DNA binding protein
MRLDHAAPASEWITLGEASRLLGIAPATLRRWSDAGRVRAFTTPGGHRRYRRAALERLIPGERSDRPSLVRSGMTANRVARAYREEARVAARETPWLIRLDDTQRDWFRQHGHRLTSALLAYLDANEPIVTEHELTEAIAEATAYGRVAAGLGLSLSQAVEAFLQFRRPFLRQLTLVARQRGFDTEATVELMEGAEAVMDRLLLAAMAAHRTERVGTGVEDDPMPAGLRPRRSRAGGPTR